MYDGGIGWGHNQYSEATIAAQSDFTSGGVLVRADAAGNGYFVIYNSSITSLILYRVDAGTLTQIAILTFTAAVGDTLRLSIWDTLLVGTVNGSNKLSVQDTKYTGGRPGLAFTNNDPGTLYDNWAGGVYERTPGMRVGQGRARLSLYSVE
jgi:hypothetical protein